jgi:hypothetical protein
MLSCSTASKDLARSGAPPRFGWAEHERTRDWWLSADRRFFERRAAEQGFQMHDQIETMFERFEVVWPPEIADFSRSPDDRPAK